MSLISHFFLACNFRRQVTTAMSNVEVPRVLVTGASGFLACHIVKQLLEGGQYIVRGTVRSLSNEKKVAPLRSLCPDSKHELELVEADLLDKDCWERAVQDCSYVLHTASPFPASNPRDEMELIKPAVDGTKSVLEACAKTKGAVKRVVMTSSLAAAYGGHVGEGRELTEDDWSDEKHCSAYEKSKTLAEKAAWEYIKSLVDDNKYELVCICPGLIYGPVLQGSYCTSMEIPRRLLQREMPMVPRLHYSTGDVRDIAKAHITALTAVKAAGNRYFAVSRSMWIQETAQILDKEFRPQGYRVPTAAAPKFGLYLMSWFDSSVKMVLPAVGKELRASNAKIKEDLGYEPTDLSKTIIDMAYSLIDAGFIRKTSQYRGRQENGTQAAVDLE